MIKSVRKRVPRWAGLLYLFAVVAGLVLFAVLGGVAGVGALETLLSVLLLLLGIPAAVYAMLHPLIKNGGERNGGSRASAEEGELRRHAPKMRERRKVEGAEPFTELEARRARSERYMARRQIELQVGLWAVRLTALVGLGALTSAFTYARRSSPGPAIWQLALYAWLAFVAAALLIAAAMSTMPDVGENAVKPWPGSRPDQDDDDEEFPQPPDWWYRPLNVGLGIVPLLGLIVPSWLGPVGLLGHWLARHLGLM